jgi:serine/threonine-protein kinase
MAMIAKKPEERPASAAAVARAATALRRGDVAAAAAAVPAIAGLAAGEATTQLLGATDASATKLMPAPGEEPVAEEGEKKKRSPWTWPLIALIALLLLVLIGTIWAVVANQGDQPDPTKSTPSHSATPKDTPTPTPTTGNIVAADYIGQDCDTASAALDALGFGAKCVEGNAAPDSASQGKVYAVAPTGNVPLATVIELTTYAGQVPMTAPAAPTLTSPIEEGKTVTVQWPGYSCPSGTGSVSAYNLTATQGVFPNTGQSTAAFGPNERSGQVQVTGAAGASLIVSYTVTCTGNGNGEERTSPSAEASGVITAAPAPEPSPTPTP